MVVDPVIWSCDLIDFALYSRVSGLAYWGSDIKGMAVGFGFCIY